MQQKKYASLRKKYVSHEFKHSNPNLHQIGQYNKPGGNYIMNSKISKPLAAILCCAVLTGGIGASVLAISSG